MSDPGPSGPVLRRSTSPYYPWRLELRLSLSPDLLAFSSSIASSTTYPSPLQDRTRLGSRRAPVPRPALPVPTTQEDTGVRPLPVPPPPPRHRSNPHMGLGALTVAPAKAAVKAPKPLKLQGVALLQPVKPAAVDEHGMQLLHRLTKTKSAWMFPDMDRYTAQRLLCFAPTGCFIIRKGSLERTLVLTVRNHNDENCDHYRIFLRDDGLQVEGSLLIFRDSQTLVEYYCLHLRELPYLLRLPHPLDKCSSSMLLEKYSTMGQAFWTAFYPRNMDEALLLEHQNAYNANGGEYSVSRRSRISYLSTKDAEKTCCLFPKNPHSSYLSTKDPRISYLSTRDKSCASSTDSLLRSSDDPPATSPDEGTASSCAMQVTVTSASAASVTGRTVSADNVAMPESAVPSNFRSSVTVRLERSQSDGPSNYDAMWEASTGRVVPVTPPQDDCPYAPPPGVAGLDLSCVPGFPQPDRFRPVFTFEGCNSHVCRPVPKQPSPAGGSDVYEDPLDLRVGPQPLSRRRPLAVQMSEPLSSQSSALRGALSDDSLSRRVASSMLQIRDSVNAMEAELAEVLPPPMPRALPPPGPSVPPRVVLRARPIPVDDPSPPVASNPPVVPPRIRRESVYDNVTVNDASDSCAPSRQPSIASSRGTVFSVPWENSLWHQVLHPTARGSLTSMDVLRQVAEGQVGDRRTEEATEEEDTDGDATPTIVKRRSRSAPSDAESKTPTSRPRTLGPDDVLHSVEEPDSGHDLVRKAQARLSEFIQPSGGRNVGASIDRWLFDLTRRADSVFGLKVSSFIECTRDASEKNPHAVMRNIRQFMDGLKHYLVQRDETGFQKIVENERKKLAADEFLNVERRLESALYNLILKPLKAHVDRLIVEWPPNAESLRRLRENLHIASKHSPERLGIRSGLQPPNEAVLERIRKYFAEMEAAYSPLVKLECLLKAVEVMYDGNVQECNKTLPQLVSTDDLMPIFTYVLVRCEFYSAEFEADYMQGLLASKFLLGEGAYYLSTLQAAAQVIKNFHRRASIGPVSSSYEDLSQLHGVLRVIVLDERTDSTNTKTFPARPTMTARDLSILVAHRCHIFNPQDYGLYHFTNGKEKELRDLELPHKIKVECEGRSEKPCHLLYRRTNAVFALPLGLSCGR